MKKSAFSEAVRVVHMPQMCVIHSWVNCMWNQRQDKAATEHAGLCTTYMSTHVLKKLHSSSRIWLYQTLQQLTTSFFTGWISAFVHFFLTMSESHWHGLGKICHTVGNVKARWLCSLFRLTSDGLRPGGVDNQLALLCLEHAHKPLQVHWHVVQHLGELGDDVDQRTQEWRACLVIQEGKVCVCV